MEFHPLAIGRIFNEFMGCWVVRFNFIQVLKEHHKANSAEPDQTPLNQTPHFRI